MGMNRFNVLCILFVSFGSVFYGYDSGMCDRYVLQSFLDFWRYGEQF